MLKLFKHSHTHKKKHLKGNRNNIPTVVDLKKKKENSLVSLHKINHVSNTSLFHNADKQQFKAPNWNL